MNKIDDEFNKAYAYCEKVLPFLNDIRYHCDKLELVVDDDLCLKAMTQLYFVDDKKVFEFLWVIIVLNLNTNQENDYNR